MLSPLNCLFLVYINIFFLEKKQITPDIILFIAARLYSWVVSHTQLLLSTDFDAFPKLFLVSLFCICFCFVSHELERL